MTTVTLGQAFQQGMREEMLRDDTIFILGTDLFRRGGHFGQVRGLGEEFGPERVRDTPISEAGIVAAGVGAALTGMRPMVDLNFIDFALGAMDEIVNQAAKMRYMTGRPVPLVIRGAAGIAGYAAQHNNSLESAFAHTPGLFVVMPSTPADTKGLIKTALRGEDPVIFLMHKRLATSRGEVGGDDDLVTIGRASVRRVGRHATVVSYGAPLNKVLEAAERLAPDVDVEVIDLRSLFPIDFDLIEESVRKTGRLIIVEEGPRHGGIGAEIAASVQEAVFDYLDKPVLRVGARYSPIPHAPPLLEAMIPQVPDIHRAIQHSVEGATFG